MINTVSRGNYVENTMRLKFIGCLFAIMCFMSLLIYDTRASTVTAASFQAVGVAINIEFPEEAHPTDTITLNLSITALTGLHLQNFTLVIKVLVDTGWQQAYKEQVLALSMVQDDVLVRLVWFTLPLKAHESLYCDMYVQTDKTSGFPATYTFYATRIRSMTYDELLANYSSLLIDYETLLASYNNLSAQYRGLNSTYRLLLNQYNSLQAAFESLNSTYFTQKASLDTLRANYDSLQASYKMLNQTYHSLEDENDKVTNTVGSQQTELTMTRYAVYALIVVAVTLAALVVYFKKKRSEPYVVLRKETVTLKQDTDQIAVH